MTTRLAAAFSILALLLFLCAPARTSGAADDDGGQIATVATVEGEAALARGGNAPGALAADAPLFLNDKIETGPGAKVHILFVDDSELTLGENAQLTLDEYVYDPDDDASSKGRFGLLRGAFIFTSGLIEKTAKPDVRLNVAYGSIGLRGTTVWGGETDSQYGVFVSDGSVSVETRRGRVRLASGEGTDLGGANAAPSRPKAWGSPRIGKALGTVALKNREKVGERVQKMKERHRVLFKKRKERREQIREKIKEGKNGEGKNGQDNGREQQRPVRRPDTRPADVRPHAPRAPAFTPPPPMRQR